MLLSNLRKHACLQVTSRHVSKETSGQVGSGTKLVRGQRGKEAKEQRTNGTRGQDVVGKCASTKAHIGRSGSNTAETRRVCKIGREAR
jgi:hypothetical protein